MATKLVVSNMEISYRMVSGLRQLLLISQRLKITLSITGNMGDDNFINFYS